MIYPLFKRSLIPLTALSVAVSLLLGSCTKKFEEFNTNGYGASNKELAADFRIYGDPLVQAQLNIYVSTPAWNTQLQQNLIGDVFSGYMCPPTPFANNINNMNYALVDGWNTYPWDDGYNLVMAPIAQSLRYSGTKYPEFYALGKILRVEAMHRVSDIYGPIIYSKYGQVNSDGSVSYDSQKDAYYAFFKDLDSAITTLTDFSNKASATLPASIQAFDLAYGNGNTLGNGKLEYKQLVKFANTLRLRLALRLAKVDATKAQTEGEAALAHPFGLMQTPGSIANGGDDYDINIGTTNHPLNTINNSWGDIRMGAPLESYLTGYSDGRAAKYVLAATDAAVAGKVKGIRQGINIDAKGRYEGYSQLVTFPNQIQLMTAAEAWFLKAEAGLRGWAGAGTVQTDYETGVKTSFAQYGLDATTYLQDGTSTAKPYTDPKSITAGQNDVLAGSQWLSTITVKWDGAASFDKNLERIITQKWLAMYPDGQEAWTEFRRTGYPKLFPVVINNSGGTISTTSFIRRINFAQSERNTNPTAVTAAIQLLGGPDNGGTRLWWDKP